MQKQFLLIITLLWATTSVATAQKKAPKEKDLEIEFGKVLFNDLAMTTYPLDSAAEAVVLAAKGRLSIEEGRDGLSLFFTKFRRVKLLKKSAFGSEGDIKITYYSKDRDEDLRSVKAAVIQPNGTRYELTKKEFLKKNSRLNALLKSLLFPILLRGASSNMSTK